MKNKDFRIGIEDNPVVVLINKIETEKDSIMLNLELLEKILVLFALLAKNSSKFVATLISNDNAISSMLNEYKNGEYDDKL